MKKNYWFVLMVFVAFVSMLALMPYHLTAAQAQETDEDEDVETIDEAENSFGQSDTFDKDSFGAGDSEEIDEEVEEKRERGDDDDDDNEQPE